MFNYKSGIVFNFLGSLLHLPDEPDMRFVLFYE